MDPMPLLLAQADAPFSMRFVVQPLLALLLGLRDGKRDADAGRPPYGFSLVTVRASRKALLRNGLKSVALPLGIAVVLDGIVQFLVTGHVELWKACVVGILLIGLPYISSRGLTNRLSSGVARRRKQRHA